MSSRLQRGSRVTGKRYRMHRHSRTGRVQRFSLNLGGNTDDTFALSIQMLRFVYYLREVCK